MKTTLKQAIINKLNKGSRDMRNWGTYSQAPWDVIKVYGKLRRIHKINYHFNNYSMIVDDVEFSTI